MSKIKKSSESGSLLKAIDGSDLKWNVFRDAVLNPFGIKISRPNEPKNIPPVVLSRLQERLDNIGRFDIQREKWRDQSAAGQGFTSATIFPPNFLPRMASPTKIQRFLSPKMTREALPRRPKSTNCLFELPSSRPAYAAAFVTEAFSELEHVSLPNSLSPAGTTIDFATGLVGSGTILHCPFLVFERCSSLEDEDIEKALNMCAISGAQCVRGIQDIAQRARRSAGGEIYSFSCAFNEQMATINIHTVDDQARYVMSALCKFDLMVDEHFNTFQAWIETIEEWASNTLLPNLKDSLTKISHSGDTPPASPMPSLTLSIDTEVGSVPGLMQALRRTYPTIAWHGGETLDSPINSSIAHCGTPAEGRRAQSMSLTTPSSGTFGNLMLRRGRGHSVISPINTRNPQLPYTPARPSPFSPRYPGTATTAPLYDAIAESPCRPGTLSPCTPPPDQPWAAKSPMLVLQKRVDIAMNEVQDLRSQVESLQSELAVKNQQLSNQLSSMMEVLQQMQKTTEDEKRRGNQVVAQVSKRRQPSRQVEFDLRAEEDIDCDTKQGWRLISLGLRYDGWDVLLEQLLFVIALVALLIMGALVFRDLLPVMVHIPHQLVTNCSRLLVDQRWLPDWKRVGRMQNLVSRPEFGRYFSIGQGLE